MAFATLVRDRADALFVAPDGFFLHQPARPNPAMLAMRHGISRYDNHSRPTHVEPVG